jgi:DnaJ-class molecular chaperone
MQAPAAKQPNEKIPIPCENCHGTGIVRGIECRECLGRGIAWSSPADWSRQHASNVNIRAAGCRRDASVD